MIFLRVGLAWYGWCRVSNNTMSWSLFGPIGRRGLHLILQDTRFKKLYLTSDTFKQITLAIQAIFRQTYNKANIQQVKIRCKRKTF